MNTGYLISLLWDSGAGLGLCVAVSFLFLVASIAPALSAKDGPAKRGHGIEKRQPEDRRNEAEA
jgi:hypothetical protein